jgi:hypothetical protein
MLFNADAINMLLIPNTYHINKVNPRSTCSCSLTYNQMKLRPMLLVSLDSWSHLRFSVMFIYMHILAGVDFIFAHVLISRLAYSDSLFLNIMVDSSLR